MKVPVFKGVHLHFERTGHKTPSIHYGTFNPLFRGGKIKQGQCKRVAKRRKPPALSVPPCSNQNLGANNPLIPLTFFVKYRHQTTGSRFGMGTDTQQSGFPGGKCFDHLSQAASQMRSGQHAERVVQKNHVFCRKANKPEIHSRAKLKIRDLFFGDRLVKHRFSNRSTLVLENE